MSRHEYSEAQDADELAALHARLDLYEAILASMWDPVYIVDAEGRITFCNIALERLTGYRTAELLGRPSLDLYVPEAAAIFHERRQRAWHGGEPPPYLETVVVRKDGRRVLVELGVTNFSPAGRLVGRIVTVRDLADRKRDEEAIQASQQQFFQLFEFNPDGLLVIDQRGLIVRANAQAATLFGFKRGELLGQPVERLIPDRFAGQHVAYRDRYLAEPRMRSMGTGLELFGRRKDGSEFPVDIMLSPLRMDEATVVLTVVRDVTDRKRAEAEARYAAQLERSNAELEQFARAISHDLQEPLRMVASYSQLLAKRYRGKLDETADEFIAYVVDGAIRMRDLIRDLLAFARLDSQGAVLTTTDCTAALEGALTNLRLALEESGATVAHDALPVVQGDPTQLTQLFQNLLSNAIKYRSAAPPQISVSVVRQGTLWRFAVQDNGIGLDPQYAERIFGGFQRLHGRDAYEGSGIGLALCKRIVERHGGRIWVESQPGTGATFYFTLPADQGLQGGTQP